MPQLVSELIVSLDNCARGTKSPAYYGYSGPELASWLEENGQRPHRALLGRNTYEMLNDLPNEARDEGWQKMTEQPGFLFSRTLESCNWPGLEVVRDDMVDFVRRLKQDSGPELRVLGSISIMRQLVTSGLLDVLRLIVCPLILPKTGTERIFEGLDDIGFELTSTKVLDRRVIVLDYRPVGAPPT